MMHKELKHHQQEQQKPPYLYGRLGKAFAWSNMGMLSYAGFKHGAKREERFHSTFTEGRRKGNYLKASSAY